MVRPAFAFIAAIVFVAQTAWANGQSPNVGRYKMIPDAVVPGKGGKLQERAVLLDSATGQTWLIAPGTRQDKRSRPIWVPIDVELPKQTNTATWSNDDPETAINPIPNTLTEPSVGAPLPFQREYDDDP